MKSTRAPNPSTGSCTVDKQSPPSLLRRLILFLDRHRRWICLIIFILYLSAYTGRWILGPDTALFGNVGRQIAEGNGYSHPLRPAGPNQPGDAVDFCDSIRGLWRIFYVADAAAKSSTGFGNPLFKLFAF